jgi:hypothetical protein
MSAVPVNDDERPLGIAAFSAVRAMGSMDVGDLQVLFGHIAGQLVARRGVLHLASVMANVLAASRRVEEPMTLAEIALIVAIRHGLDVDDLRLPASVPGARVIEIAYPRQEAFWLARQQRRPNGEPRHSLPAIGKFFGGRDHTTILYGVRRHAERLLKEPIA